MSIREAGAGAAAAGDVLFIRCAGEDGEPGAALIGGVFQQKSNPCKGIAAAILLFHFDCAWPAFIDTGAADGNTVPGDGEGVLRFIQLEAFGSLKLPAGIRPTGQILEGQLAEGVGVSLSYLVARVVVDTEARAGQANVLVLVLLDDLEVALHQPVLNGCALGFVAYGAAVLGRPMPCGGSAGAVLCDVGDQLHVGSEVIGRGRHLCDLYRTDGEGHISAGVEIELRIALRGVQIRRIIQPENSVHGLKVPGPGHFAICAGEEFNLEHSGAFSDRFLFRARNGYLADALMPGITGGDFLNGDGGIAAADCDAVDLGIQQIAGTGRQLLDEERSTESMHPGRNRISARVGCQCLDPVRVSIGIRFRAIHAVLRAIQGISTVAGSDAGICGVLQQRKASADRRILRVQRNGSAARNGGDLDLVAQPVAGRCGRLANVVGAGGQRSGSAVSIGIGGNGADCVLPGIGVALTGIDAEHSPLQRVGAVAVRNARVGGSLFHLDESAGIGLQHQIDALVGGRRAGGYQFDHRLVVVRATAALDVKGEVVDPQVGIRCGGYDIALPCGGSKGLSGTRRRRNRQCVAADGIADPAAAHPGKVVIAEDAVGVGY